MTVRSRDDLACRHAATVGRPGNSLPRRRPAAALPLVGLIVAAVIASGCARASGTPAQQVTSWANQSGIVGLDATVAGDVHDFEGALAAGKQGTARTLCGVLEEDVGPAYDELPSPDQQLTNDLNGAYLTLGQGADDCYRALGGGNKALLTKSLGEIRSGSGLLAAADARLASFGVHAG